MRERTVEQHLVARVKARGGYVRKVRWIGVRGAPDRLVALPNWYCFVELKRPGKDLDDHQAREFSRMKAMGLNVALVDSIEAVDVLLDAP